jgi:hypothetical protein
MRGRLCRCGCGQETNIIKHTSRILGNVKGDHRKYVYGHKKRGSRSPVWRGGRKIDDRGRIHIHIPGHPRSGKTGYVLEHILVAERAIGKHLPVGAVVHHANEKRDDNRPLNLVVCENDGYHQLLHRRLRAVKAGFPKNYRKCKYCKDYDDPASLYMKNGNNYHRRCQSNYGKERRENVAGK